MVFKCQSALLGLEERDKHTKYKAHLGSTPWFSYDLYIVTLRSFLLLSSVFSFVKQTCFLALRIRVALGLGHLEGFVAKSQSSRKSLFK